MKKGLKITLIVAGVAIAVGLALTLVAFASVGFDPRGLDGSTVEARDYEFNIDEIENVSVDSELVDVKIVSSEQIGALAKVEIVQDKRIAHDVRLENGTLKVRSGDRPWYFSIGIFIARQSIVITLPQGAGLDSVNVETDVADVDLISVIASRAQIKSDTGDLTVKSSELGELYTELDTGDAELQGSTLKSLTVESDTGDVDIANTVVSGKITVKSDTGDVEIDKTTANELYAELDTGDITAEGFDAGVIYIKCEVGDVELYLLSGKNFDATSTVGKVRVPSDMGGGSCTVRVNVGDVEIRVKD